MEKEKDIGNTYVNRGGMEIGKCFQPKHIFSSKHKYKNYNWSKRIYAQPIVCNQTENLANEVASKIIKIVFELPV